MNEIIKALEAEINWPRETMDVDYNARNSVTTEVFDREISNYRKYSDEAFAKIGTYKNILYDQSTGQCIDVLGTVKGELRPVFIFIHGGYWKLLSKEDSSFMAPNLADHGIATVAVDYQLIPDVDLTEITRQVRAAIAFVWHEGHKYGLDKNCIYVSGSSAGGHLTGTTIANGWHSEFIVPTNIIKGAVPISGIFHLNSMVNSFVQDWLNLPLADVKKLSPICNIPHQDCPIVVAYGAEEKDGFIRQSHAFHKIWQEHGFQSNLIPIENRNHFDVVFELMDSNSKLTRSLLAMIEASS